MFQFLFKFPLTVFSKGTFVLAGSWPKWMLSLLAILLAGLLGYGILRKFRQSQNALWIKRAAILWLLQSAVVATLLLLLWQPAISITALRPQQNVIAVVVDDSRSMSLADEGSVQRQAQAIQLLKTKLLPALKGRFQVRLYRLTDGVARIGNLDTLHATGAATQIGSGLRSIASQAGTLPIGAVVLLTDGADNLGGIDLETLNALRGRRLPVNTIGFGSSRIKNDIELDALLLPANALQNSRLQAQVTLHQNGFSGKPATLVLTEGGRVKASRDITLQSSPQQVETLEFNAGKSGVQDIVAELRPLAGETNRENNRLKRILAVDAGKRRILYVEGEPRWDYKFIRRAAEDDPAIEVVSMLRTTQSKIYRQGISSATELADGFPDKPEDLFRYESLMIGSIESGFFSPQQQRAIQEFVDRRGGGLLFLGGRASLSDGDYDAPPFSELLPVHLPRQKNTFSRSLVAAELTDEGRRSLICRIEDDSEKSNDHWDVLPYLANYQNAGTPKPGAVVLARMNVGGNRLPLLITENYGRGRTAVFATGGSWRWRMQQPVADTSEETFWRQLLRWAVSGSPSRVLVTATNVNLQDSGMLVLRAEVRDKLYRPTNDAEVDANIIKPDGSAERIPLHPDRTAPGVYAADWNAANPGSYVAEVTAKSGAAELGRGVLPFQRQDGIAEDFHREQNRDLLEKLSEETGGRYYTPATASHLPEEISFSQAGISARELKDLWDMPAIFLALLLLRGTEWLLRRRWGVV